MNHAEMILAWAIPNHARGVWQMAVIIPCYFCFVTSIWDMIAISSEIITNNVTELCRLAYFCRHIKKCLRWYLVSTTINWNYWIILNICCNIASHGSFIYCVKHFNCLEQTCPGLKTSRSYQAYHMVIYFLKALFVLFSNSELYG